MAASLDDINAQLAGPLPASPSTGNVGVRRRQAAPTVVDTTPDYQREWGATVERTKGYAPTVAGFARQVAGDQQGAAEDYAAAKVRDERAAQLDSDVSTDWRDVGSLGDAFRYARKLAIGSVPDMALSVGAGGVARMGARRLAADAERRAVMGRISAELSETGATSPLARAAIEKAGERSARAATAQVAERQFGEAVADTARMAVGRNAAAQARIDRAGRAAGFVGATAGQFPGMLSESREQLEKTDQAGAMKIGAADLAASAVGALPTERLMGRLFQTPAAKEGLGRQLAMAVPRIAKETGQQALFEGSTEAAQAFVQRAGHKWVDDNVGLLTPEAIQDYVANFVGGAVLGGASGGAVETANHGGAAVRGVAEGVRSGIDHAARGGRWVWDQGGTVREAVRDYLTSKSPFFQRAAEAVAGAPGSPRRQAAAGLGERVSEAARGATEAGKRFYEHLRSGERQDDAEARTDGVMERLDEAMRADVEAGTPLGDLVGHLPSFTQKWAMSHFAPAYLATKSPQAVADMASLLERLATGKEISRRERDILVAQANNPDSGLTMAKLDTIGALGPLVQAQVKRMQMKADGASYAERSKVRSGYSPVSRTMNRLSESAGVQAPELKADSTFNESGAARAATESDALGGEQESGSEIGLNPIEDASRGDRTRNMTKFEQALEARDAIGKQLTFTERPTAPAEGMTNRETFQTWKSERKAREEYNRLNNELRELVLGQKTENNPEGAFTFRQNNSPKGKEAWAKAEASPEYVTTDQTYDFKRDVDGQVEKRKLAIHLPSALSAFLARNGSLLPQDPKARGQAALAGVIGELQSAGVNIDPNTLVAGDIFLPANHRRAEPEYVGTISQAFIDTLKLGPRDSAAEGAARVRKALQEGALEDTRPEAVARGRAAQANTTRKKKAELAQLIRAEIEADPAVAKRVAELRSQARAVRADQAMPARDKRITLQRLARDYGQATADAARRATNKLEPSDYAQGRLEEVVQKLAEEFHEGDLDAARDEIAQARRTAGREATSDARERDDDTSFQEQDHRLVPREAPRGTVTRGDPRRFTSSLEVIADVGTELSHGSIIKRMSQFLEGSGFRAYHLAAAYAKWRGNRFNKQRNALFSAMQDNGKAYHDHLALKSMVDAAQAELDLANATNTKQRNALTKAFRAKIAEVEYARAYTRTAERMAKTGKGLQESFDAFMATPSGLRAANVVDRIGSAIAKARADGDAKETDRLVARLQKAQRRTPKIRTAIRFASVFAAQARAERAAIEQFAAEEAAKIAKGKRATGVPLTKAQAKADLVEARKKLREFERDTGAMAQVEAYESAVAQLEDRTQGTEKVPSYSTHDLAASVAKAELDERLAEGHITTKKYVSEIEAIRDPQSGAAEQYLAEVMNAEPTVTHAKEDAADTAFNSNEQGAAIADQLLASMRDALVRMGESVLGSKHSDLGRAIEEKLESLNRADRLTPDERRFLADVGMYVDGIAPEFRESDRLAQAYDAWMDHQIGRDDYADAPRAATSVGVSGEARANDGPDPSKVSPERRAELAKKLAAEKKGRSTSEESEAAEREGRKANYGKATPLNPALRPAPVERLDDTTPVPRKRGKQVIKSVPQAQAAVDATENAGVASATAKTGPHDLKAEKEMLNEVLAQMGVPKLLSLKPLSKTDAKGAPRSPNTGGSYMLRTVQINDTLHGAERVEVLLHETGHHIYAAELAKAMGVEQQAVINMTDAQLLDALEKHLPAVAAEYSAWMAERGNAATVPLFQSSAPTYRQRGLATRNGGGAKVTRSTSIHEWMADNIARALAGRRETQSAVGKFFKAIADQLRTFYDTMAGKSPRLAPAKSVEAWVDSLFNRETNAVREATGQAATQVQARAVVAAAVRSEAAPTDPTVPPAPPAAPKPKAGKPKPPKDMDGMMQYVRDFLPPQERKILEQVFKRVQGKLRRVYAKRPDVLEAMASAEHGMEATIAAGYLAWKAGKFKTGSKSGSALLTISEDLHKVVGLAGPGDYAQSILKDMASGRVQAMKQNGHTYDIVKQEARARGQLQQAVNKLGDVKEAIMRPIDRAMAGVGRQMFESGIPAMRKIAGLLYRPAGTTGADRGMVREVVHTTASFAEKANAALQGLSAGEQRRVMRLLQEQAAPEQINAKVSKRVGNKRNVNHGNYRYSKGVRDAVQAVRKLMDDSFKYMESAGVQVGYRKDFFPVLLDIRNENARAQLTALLSDPVYEASIREFFDKPKDTEPKGKGKPKGKPKGKRKAGNVPPLPAEHEAFFEKQRAKLEKRIANGSGNPTQLHNLIAVNMSVVEAMRTGNIATIEKHIAAAEARQERYDVDSDAYKTIDLELRFAKARIKQLSEAGASAEAAAEPSAAEPSAADNTLQGMIKNLVDGAVRGEAASLPSDAAPRFRGASFRLMEFIYRLRDEAVKSGDPEAIAKHNANVKTFASLQTHNPAEVFARYIEPMVRKAEYARRFGHDGEKLEAMLEAMKKQGATEDQVQHAREAVEAAAGTYGQDLSPTLEALSPALAKRFAGRKTRATISGLQAYQNARLLPLSLLSSLVDPMGIAVRSGGDFAVAWTGIRDGMSSITNKASREQLHDMLRLLGSAEDMGSMEALQQGFGGAGNITAAKVNEFVFKWNGMAAWTRTTRYMALLSAHAFMLKHGADATAGKAKAAREDAESPRARSQRYLMELGVQPGDIKPETVTLPSGRTRDQVRLLSAGERAKATAEQLAADDRVRRALMQFVDEAILRPNSQQTPQWHSDPYMGLVTQYKAFGYAIYDQIMGRIDVELSNGNAKVLLAAGAYVPIVVMAEMLRNVAQGDTDDTEDWGPDDWLWLGVERSGLYSPQFGALESAVDDTREGRGPLASQIGPTASQARDLGKVAFGQRSAGKTFESALPGSTLYKKWNDGPAQELE